MTESRVWPTIATLACALLVIALLLSPTQAALAQRPPRWPTPTPKLPKLPKLPNGAIELTVASAPAGLWTVVQWQDALGGWHDVAGWQGTLDEGDKKTWWVDKADYGKGPFRWVVYQAQGGDLLGTSESFYLPSGHGQIVTIEVSLAP
jgi:hypothetical protein